MKKVLKKILKVLMWILIVIVSLVVLLLAVRFIGKMINSRTPKNGINENMYIDVNGQQQWISIYGENKDNPIMLYLHGGPGYSTSYADWAITRKLAGDYTVISWDQRDCAKTWIKDPKREIVTADMMRSDLEVMVDYLLEYLDKDSLTFLGISWGTYYGCDYAYSHPDKVDCIINLSQVVDNELGWLGEKEDLLKKTENDPENHKLAEEYDPLFFFPGILFRDRLRGDIHHDSPDDDDIHSYPPFSAGRHWQIIIIWGHYTPASPFFRDSQR